MPSSVVATLQSQPWCGLLQIIGDSAMLALLCENALFVPLHGGTLLQVRNVFL